MWFNKEADFLANHAMNTKQDFLFVNSEFFSNKAENLRNLQGWSDGGCRVEEKISSYGWLIKGWLDTRGPFILAAGAKFFDQTSVSSLEIEAKGMLALWSHILLILANKTSTILSTGTYPKNTRKRRWLDGTLFRHTQKALLQSS